MTLANTFAAKLSVAFVATAMLFTLAAPAKAQTTEELQKMINDLLAQVAALQGQVGGSTTAAGVCPFTWTRSLSQGSTGADVMKLQQFLNADAETRVAATGAGSVGMETQTFGPATAAAVSKFQVKYRADILTPAGLVNPTGYFGPSSMAKANALCTTGSTPTTPGDDDEDDDSSSVTLSGEASLDDVTMNDGDDTTLEEGQEAAPVAEMEVEFADGDAKISRIDVSLVGSGDEQDPWDTFEEVSLWVDGDEVATKAADDEDDYLDEDDGSLRFSGLDIVAMEDEALTIVIAVTVQGSVDGTNNGEAWEVAVDSIRYMDADDVTTTDTTTGELGDAIDFTIEEAGADDELAVKSSAEDPDATTLQLEDDAKSDWMTVFAFDLDTDDSVNDIEISSIPVTIVVANDQFGDIVSDLQLVIDGEEYDDWSYATGAAASTTVVIEFDTDDLVVDAGDRVTAELQVEFKQLATEGATIQGKVTSANADDIDAEGADELSDSQTSGSATGETHTLRTSGAILELTSTTETVKTNAADDVSDDQGVFTLKFDVTAFESDIWVNKSAASGTGNGTAGVNFLVENASGSQVTLGTSTASLSSTADTDGTRFKVAEGETETFTLTVNYDPTTAGSFFQVQLYSFNFDTDNDDPSVWQRALPEADFETDQLSI